MAIKSYVSNDFGSTFADSINVFYGRLPGVFMHLKYTPFRFYGFSVCAFACLNVRRSECKLQCSLS